LVDVRRLVALRAEAAHIGVAHVIHEDDDDVRQWADAAWLEIVRMRTVKNERMNWNMIGGGSSKRWLTPRNSTLFPLAD
jgi:hypothetical protein